MTGQRTATVVLDDDPTGSQSAADVPVVLRPGREAFTRVLAASPSVYVLTNTRAMDEAAAVALVRQVRDDALAAAEQLGMTAEFVLRGDSTLRGHVFAESDVFREDDSVILFSPAFPAGGRVTRNAVHYVRVDGEDVPAADTEFARDPVFGYRGRTLGEYVAEVGAGRAFAGVPLAELRRRGGAAVADTLLTVPASTVVTPDSETDADLVEVHRGLALARGRGRPVVVRCGAPLAALCAGVFSGEPLPTPVARPDGPVLVVCGSHTEATTRQLSRLTDTYGPHVPLPTDAALENPRAAAEEVARAARDVLRRRGLAVIASDRVRRPEHGGLDHGERIMDALTGAVRRLADEVAGVIAKGGITSAETARTGLDASTATVRGQILPGVSLWDLHRRSGDRLPYAVVPGNVGTPDTLLLVARAFGR